MTVFKTIEGEKIEQLQRDIADLKRENERLKQEKEQLEQDLEDTQLQALDDMCRCE